MNRPRPPALVMTLTLVIATACTNSGPDLPPNQLNQVSEALVSSTEAVAITLSDSETDCVVSKLTTQEAIDLVGLNDLTPDLQETIPEAIVGCVGAGPIVSGVVSEQVPGVSESELECAVDRIDRDLAVVLVASALDASVVSKPSVELSLASALAFCLSTENLLDQG